MNHNRPNIIASSTGGALVSFVIIAQAFFLSGCASNATNHTASHVSALDPAASANRISWGVTPTLVRQIDSEGVLRYIDEQLRAPHTAPLLPAAQQQINALTIQRKSLVDLVGEFDTTRQQNDGIQNDDEKKAAQQTYQKALNQLQREASTRFLLRALYSEDQLLEQLTWFWFNHFNIHAGKADLRVMIGDYEESAIRAHALSRFRDLLSATVRHPAMLRYLDNQQNSSGHLNENYARELLELHTLGVDGGYTQRDVQELARVLTGFGVFRGNEPKLRRELQEQYQHRGLFEFNPARHDYGHKEFLGHTIAGRGSAELDEVLDILSRHPATAKFVSGKLAAFFVSDKPSPGLIERMAATFRRSDGDIKEILRTLFASDEFAHSLGTKFKDPLHYVVAAVRYAYDEKIILNAAPMINWLNRMGEPLYGKQTPDGYPLAEAAWASAGQMTTRFEIAHAIASGSAGLFKPEEQNSVETPAFPQLANALYYQSIEARLSGPTRKTLEQAKSPQEWGTLLLASPEMMYR